MADGKKEGWFSWSGWRSWFGRLTRHLVQPGIGVGLLGIVGLIIAWATGGSFLILGGGGALVGGGIVEVAQLGGSLWGLIEGRRNANLLNAANLQMKVEDLEMSNALAHRLIRELSNNRNADHQRLEDLETATREIGMRVVRVEGQVHTYFDPVPEFGPPPVVPLSGANQQNLGGNADFAQNMHTMFHQPQPEQLTQEQSEQEEEPQDFAHDQNIEPPPSP